MHQLAKDLLIGTTRMFHYEVYNWAQSTNEYYSVTLPAMYTVMAINLTNCTKRVLPLPKSKQINPAVVVVEGRRPTVCSKCYEPDFFVNN
jgi:hypothetical protein